MISLRVPSTLLRALSVALVSFGLSVIDSPHTELKQSWARRQKQLREDPLALARRLLRDEEVERALIALKEVDTSAPGFDQGEYERLMGLITYQTKDYTRSADHFERALKLGDQDPSLFYLFARTLSELKREARALDILDQAPAALWESEAVWRLKLQLTYKSRGPAETYPTLELMIQRFPDRADLREQRLRLLCELGLFQEASDLMITALKKPTASVEQLAAYARILSETGREAQSSLLLEKGLLIFESADLPQPQLRQMLAHSYLTQGRSFSAAEILAPLALSEPTYALYTAELYRQSGQMERALWVNRLVADQTEKIKQRLTLLIEGERYEESAALLDRVERLGLLSNESIAYALAYSFYRIYDFPSAHRMLSHLVSDAMYEKGTQLRRAIDQCQLDAGRCE